MHIIKRKRLVDFYKSHSDSKAPLEAWYCEMKDGSFYSPRDIKSKYPSASIIPDNRAVFNIKGNKYRLVVHFRYNKQTGFIKFVGTHAEYDKIDAELVQ